MSKEERHFFLNEKGKKLYCVEYFSGDRKEKNHSVILCKPIWGERIRTHIIFSNLARLLSGRSFIVITCDYFGDGNSGGETLDLNYFSMVEDIGILYEYLKQNYNLKSCSLVGLRLGANVAMGAEGKIDELRKLVLFEPVLNPIELFNKALRANLATQMAIHKKILKTREQLIKDLENGIPVNIDGFVIGKKFWESFAQVSPLKVESGFDKPVSLYSLVLPGKKGSDYSILAQSYQQAEVKSIKQEFDWTAWKSYIPKPDIFFGAVTSELEV